MTKTLVGTPDPEPVQPGGVTSTNYSSSTSSASWTVTSSGQSYWAASQSSSVCFFEVDPQNGHT